MFNLKFKTDNAAFGDPGDEFTPECQAEISRILRRVAEQVTDGRDHALIFDINGNTIGEWHL